MGRNLITGGMGLFGVYLARQLLADGEEVVLFQRRSQLPGTVADLEGNVKIFSGDVGNWEHVVHAMKSNDIDCIYHSAALLSEQCKADPLSGFRVNFGGTMNVLEAARTLGIKDVIFVSSGATYGTKNPPRKVYNDTPQNPENLYTTSKVCCELLGEQYRRDGVDFRAIRYAMVVGATRQISYYYGDWSGIIERTAQGKPYVAHSNPTSPCAYIYIKDAVRALVDLRRAVRSKLRQSVYNAHGFMATLTQVAETIKKYIPEAQIGFDWDRSETMKLANSGVNYEMDNSVAQQDFGYEPHYLLDEMVKDFINEVRRP